MTLFGDTKEESCSLFVRPVINAEFDASLDFLLVLFVELAVEVLDVDNHFIYFVIFEISDLWDQVTGNVSGQPSSLRVESGEFWVVSTGIRYIRSYILQDAVDIHIDGSILIEIVTVGSQELFQIAHDPALLLLLLLFLLFYHYDLNIIATASKLEIFNCPFFWLRLVYYFIGIR